MAGNVIVCCEENLGEMTDSETFESQPKQWEGKRLIVREF